MLHSYVADLKDGFLPYVQDVAQVLVPLIKFQYMDDVRTASMMAMPELLQSAILALKAAKPGATPEFVQQLKEFMIVPIIEQLKTEPDVEALTCMLDSFSEMLALGPECPQAALTQEQLQSSAQLLQMLVQESLDRRVERQAKRTDEPDEDEEEELEGQAEQEECLVQNLTDCVGQLFKAYKSAFLPVFDAVLLPLFQAMLQPSAITSDRVAALCIFDDVIEHCSADGASARYIPALMPAFMQYAQDAETEVRQAAVYGIGMLAEHCVGSEAFAQAQMQQAAQVLVTVCNHAEAQSEDNASATDNAVSALGRLCKRDETIAAIGYPRWLQALPLSADKAEARVVHQHLCELVESSNRHLLGASNERLPDIICVFGQLLESDEVEEELNPRMKHLLKQVHAGLPQVLQALPTHPGFQKLTDEHRRRLEQALST
jgi:hypothetical protein